MAKLADFTIRLRVDRPWPRKLRAWLACLALEAYCVLTRVRVHADSNSNTLPGDNVEPNRQILYRGIKVVSPPPADVHIHDGTRPCPLCESVQGRPTRNPPIGVCGLCHSLGGIAGLYPDGKGHSICHNCHHVNQTAGR